MGTTLLVLAIIVVVAVMATAGATSKNKPEPAPTRVVIKRTFVPPYVTYGHSGSVTSYKEVKPVVDIYDSAPIRVQSSEEPEALPSVADAEPAMNFWHQPGGGRSVNGVAGIE